MLRSLIWDEIIRSEYKTIGVIGMAKNAGKTVTLNALIEYYYKKKQTIGIISIGRDGESEDVLTKTAKPRITLHDGMLFATGEVFLDMANLNFEILQRTPFDTYFGNMVICRAKSTGNVEISGANSHSAHCEIMSLLLRIGAEHVLVDGAMDRQTIASPELLDAVILASGAVLSRTMEKVVRLTASRVEQLTVKSLPSETADVILKQLASHAVVLIQRGETGIPFDNQFDFKEPYRIKTIEGVTTGLNAGNEILAHVDDETVAVCIAGALTTRMIDTINKSKPRADVAFIVKDGTKIYIDYENWLRFKAKRIKIYVLNPLKLLAITINPTAPQGYIYDGEKFKNMMQSVVAIPVVDVMK